MKKLKYIFAALIFAISYPAVALAERPDTLMTVDSPSRIIITESREGTRLTVTDTISNIKETILVEYTPGAKVTTSRHLSRGVVEFPGYFKFNKNGYAGNNRRGDGWILGLDGVCVGLNNAMSQTGGGGLQWSKSFEISWLSCLYAGYSFSRSQISLGLGFDWRNYKATADARWMVPDGNGGVTWGSAPEDASEVRYSRLKVFSLQMPLLYSWSIPKTRLRWRMGPILNFNTYASLLGAYIDAAGNNCEYFTKDLGRNRVTVDFFGSLSYSKAIGIYVRYSPMKVLNASSPINFTPFTVGVGFFI